MIVFKNARVFDGHGPGYAEGMTVVVEGDTIREVSKKAGAKGARVIDLKGKTLMPGLIDAHMHAYAMSAAGITRSPRRSPTDWCARRAIYMSARRSR